MKKYVIYLMLLLFCFTSNAQAPDWILASSAGGPGMEAGNDLAIDLWGNIYVTGSFQSTAFIVGSDTLINKGNHDFYLIKYDSMGNLLWATSAGGIGADAGASVSVDHLGNAFVTGFFSSSIICFGTDTLLNSGGYDMVLIKYDINGNVLWAKSAKGSSDELGISVAVNPDGGPVVTGKIHSPYLIFASDTIWNHGGKDIFLAQYSSTGILVWARSDGGAGREEPTSIAIDSIGNIYVTGYYEDANIILGNDTLVNNGMFNMFLVKYSASGNAIWARPGGNSGTDVSYSVGVGSGGNVYLTGFFTSPTIAFGTVTLTNTGSGDVFLVKYNSGGDVLWAKNAKGTGDDGGQSLTINTDGSVYLTGYFRSPTLIFGLDTLTNLGIYDIFIVKYDTAGNSLWAKHAGSTGDDEGFSIELDAIGNAYITGRFSSPSIAFGLTTLTNAGNSDIFLAKLSATATGTAELDSEAGISLFPNPASSWFTIVSQSNAQVEIVNFWGQMLKSLTIARGINVMDISGYANGLYFVRVKYNNQLYTQKLIVENE